MPRAVTLEGKVEAWERWTGMRFAESGEYLVDGAQTPVIIDRENNSGYYADAYLWMRHKT